MAVTGDKSRGAPRGTMRMAELSRRSGVARETIHYYLREGLLPRPRKGGRTVAYYDEEHLERLKVIRRLREEKYLPLAVIRGLLDSHTASADQDVDTLAEVLNISALHEGPGSGPEGSDPETFTQALRVANQRGLLGPPREGGASAPASDSAEARILGVVDEVLALDEPARDFTLADLETCARDVATLVNSEAALFFDTVIRKADIGGTIQALRAGRGAVARYITAYRDLMLRRIVEDLLLAVQHGPMVIAGSATVPLSARAERELGALERRAALRQQLERGGDISTAATDLIWHLFGCRALGELGALSADVTGAADARARVLVAWAGYEASRSLVQLTELEKASEAAPEFALGQILTSEAKMSRGVRRLDEGASVLESAIPALHRLVIADPDADENPLARALSHFHRGRVDLVLPPVLGRRARGVDAMRRALEIANDPAFEAQIEPAARARLLINARLSLGRHYAAVGEPALARRLLEDASSVDPDGPIGDIVREQLATRSGMGAK